MKKLIFGLIISFLFFIPLALRAADHGGIEAITLSPLEKEVRAGNTVNFTLTASDENGQTWDISQSALFSVNDPRGEMDGNTYLAGKAGTWTVTVTYGNFTARTKVTVVPGAVSKIIVNPQSQPETVILGEKQQFSAQAFDRMSNLIKGEVFTWTTEGEVGLIDQNGFFEPRDIGEGKIIASFGNVSGTSEILVREKTLLPPVNTSSTVNQNTNTAPANQPAQEQEEENAAGLEDGEIAGAETAAAQEATEEESTCRQMAWWVWLLFLVGFTALMIIYYFLIRKAKTSWWWLFPLLLAAVAIWLYYQYACNQHGWWPWIMIIVAIVVTLFRPKKYFEEPKEPSF